jgi:hypothetical protein
MDFFGFVYFPILFIRSHFNQQKMAFLRRAQIQDLISLNLQGVVLVQLHIISGQISFQAGQVALAISPVCVNYFFRIHQPGSIDIGILGDLDHALSSSTGSQVQQSVCAGLPGEMLAVITWFQAICFGGNPDLIKTQCPIVSLIFFAVGDTGTGGQVLDITGSDGVVIAQTIAMREFALYTVGEDLHLRVGMRVKPAVWLQHEFIQCTQHAEIHILRIFIFRVGKVKSTAVPAVVSVVNPLGGNSLQHLFNPQLK